FFQAEDGIRDGHVTGVQTCALPICQPGRVGLIFVVEMSLVAVRHRDKAHLVAPCPQKRRGPANAQLVVVWMSPNTEDMSVCHERSEERGVGKECECGWGGSQ